MEQQARIMQERQGSGPTGLDDPFAADPFGDFATINGEQLPVAGMTLGEIRYRLADRARIEPRSNVVINGEPVDDEHRVVRAGEVVEFQRPAGEKGTA